MKFEQKAEHLVKENERLAKEAEREMLNPSLSPEERSDAQERARVYRQMAQEWAVTMHAPAKIRALKEARGLKNVNSNRRDAAADRVDEVRAVYKTGDSAEAVRRKIIRAGGEAYALRSIQRDLKKIREGEK